MVASFSDVRLSSAEMDIVEVAVNKGPSAS
jgi:hypothetical protein